MANNKLVNLKSQLLTSGLSQRDAPLFQVINQLIQYLQDLGNEVTGISSSSGGSSSAITGLNTDVVATGPGNVVATIQPNVVTYAKIQQVTAERLLGNPTILTADVSEIELGENLEFIDDVLQVTVPGSGVPGILHRLLSTTHPDTVAAEPIEGDIIYAGPGVPFEGTYVNAQVLVAEVLDLPIGIYGWLYIGFENNGFLGPIGGAISPLFAENIIQEATPSWLTWDILSPYILVQLIITNPMGIYGMLYGNILDTGAFYGCIPFPFTLGAPESLEPGEFSTGLWRRKAIGGEGQVLTVVDGIPEWEDLPPIPDEPEYPWNDISFSAGDFTAAGGTTPTWTVPTPERWQYQVFPGLIAGPTNVRIAFYVRASTVGGTAPTQLIIQLPFNLTGRFAQFISIQENGAVANGVYVEYNSGVSADELFIQKIGGAVFDTTAAGTYLAFEISATLA